MSGIYIPMEMPRKTGVVNIVLSGDGSALLCEDGVYSEIQAIPVPDRGDLIDRDALERDIDKYIGGEESRARFHHWVQVQSVVIPGDKEEET